MDVKIVQHKLIGDNDYNTMRMDNSTSDIKM